MSFRANRNKIFCKTTGKPLKFHALARCALVVGRDELVEVECQKRPVHDSQPAARVVDEEEAEASEWR